MRGLRELYEQYKATVAYVEVEDRSSGDRGIGTAFHIGDGIFITARHVVSGKNLLSIGTTFPHYTADPAGRYSRGSDGETYRCTEPFSVTNAATLLPSSSGSEHSPADVAALVVTLPDALPVMRLGGHLDDWMGKDDMMLDRVLVMGYPPVPFVIEPKLLAVSCEVNALIDRRDRHHPHFLISSMARGGFSGGPVVHGEGFVLGFVTESLVQNGNPEQLGFMTVLSVEPIYMLLREHGVMPTVQKEGWDELWDPDRQRLMHVLANASTPEEHARANSELRGAAIAAYSQDVPPFRKRGLTDDER